MGSCSLVPKPHACSAPYNPPRYCVWCTCACAAMSPRLYYIVKVVIPSKINKPTKIFNINANRTMQHNNYSSINLWDLIKLISKMNGANKTVSHRNTRTKMCIKKIKNN